MGGKLHRAAVGVSQDEHYGRSKNKDGVFDGTPINGHLIACISDNEHLVKNIYSQDFPLHAGIGAGHQGNVGVLTRGISEKLRGVPAFYKGLIMD